MNTLWLEGCCWRNWRAGRGRPRLCWIDGVKVDLGSRGMTVEAAQQSTKDRKEWIALVHKLMIEFHAAIFAWPCVLWDRLPTIWWIINWRRVACR